MKIAHIENGVVTNISVWEARPDFGVEIGERDVDIGDLYDAGIFTKPAPPPLPTPSVVSMRQARLALLGAGLLQQIKDAIATMPEAAQIEWEYATEVNRDSPLVAGMAAALSLTEAQLDGLFRSAETL